jgi:hypothetical protein
LVHWSHYLHFVWHHSITLLMLKFCTLSKRHKFMWFWLDCLFVCLFVC